MKRFISVVSGIVIAAIVVVALGSFGILSLLKHSHTSLKQVSSGQTLLNSSKQSPTQKKVGGGNSTASNTTGSNTTGSKSNVSSSNATPTATDNSSSTNQTTTASAQTGQPLTATQQKHMASSIQLLLTNPANQPKDCSAFVQYVYTQANFNLPRTVAQQATVGSRIQNKSQLQYGDIVFFNLSSKQNQVTFDGIYVGNGQFVAKTTHGIKSIQLNGRYWKNKFVYGQRV